MRTHSGLFRGLGALCLCAGLAAATSVPAQAAHGTSSPSAKGATTVRPGASIQQALDHVPDGGTVVVARGVYAESLTIVRPVRLLAEPGTVLVPPGTAPDNLCTHDPDAPDGVIPGVCIAGAVADPDAEAPPVVSPVRNVRVSGLTVRDFDFAAVEVYGAQGLTIDHVTATEDAGGGVFVAKSQDVQLRGLDIHGTGGRGLDLHQGNRDVVVRDSSIVDNQGEGVFIGELDRGLLRHNRVRGNCMGISAVDLGLPGQTGISHLLIQGNSVTGNDRYCSGNAQGTPSQSGTGIALVGVSESRIVGNVVRDNVGSTGPSGEAAHFSLGGIALLDAGPITGGATPHDNLFTDNVVTGNEPVDVLADASGDGNVFRRNTCSTSTLANVCTGRRMGGRP